MRRVAKYVARGWRLPLELASARVAETPVPSEAAAVLGAVRAALRDAHAWRCEVRRRVEGYAQWRVLVRWRPHGRWGGCDLYVFAPDVQPGLSEDELRPMMCAIRSLRALKRALCALQGPACHAAGAPCTASPRFQLQYRALSGHHRTVDGVSADDSGEAVRRTIASQEGVPEAAIRLLLRGKPLDLEAPCKLTRGEAVHVVANLRGGTLGTLNATDASGRPADSEPSVNKGVSCSSPTCEAASCPPSPTAAAAPTNTLGGAAPPPPPPPPPPPCPSTAVDGFDFSYRPRTRCRASPSNHARYPRPPARVSTAHEASKWEAYVRECCRQGAPIRANEETCDAAPADGRTSPPSSDAAMELPAASPAIKVDACATVAADAADGGEGQGGEAPVSEARQAALHEIDPPLALILMLCQRHGRGGGH